jgi:hypothetical protein
MKQTCKSLKRFIKACEKNDHQASHKKVMDVIHKGLELMAVTGRFLRMEIICGDITTRPDGLAEFWCVDLCANGEYKVFNEEGMDDLQVANVGDAWKVFKCAMSSKVISSVCLSSVSSKGYACNVCLFDGLVDGYAYIDRMTFSAQVKHAAATKIQRMFRECITNPKHPFCQRRLIREFNEISGC